MVVVEETDNRFYIDKSTLPNAGWGCFAKESLRKGDCLEIIGVMVKNSGVADFCTHYAKRYKFAASKQLDHKVVPMGYGGMVNHTDDPSLQNVCIAYKQGRAKQSEHACQLVYEALRDIEVGEELLGNYGENVGLEVRKHASNVAFLEENKDDWEVFLSYNLYGIKEILDVLC